MAPTRLARQIRRLSCHPGWRRVQEASPATANGAYVQLLALWRFPKGPCQVRAVYGVANDGALRFWSFTSGGKRSEGTLADVSDLHAIAIGFEAQKPSGLARMAYWPDDAGGLAWTVEAQGKMGWKRFTEHHYHRS